MGIEIEILKDAMRRAVRPTSAIQVMAMCIANEMTAAEQMPEVCFGGGPGSFPFHTGHLFPPLNAANASPKPVDAILYNVRLYAGFVIYPAQSGCDSGAWETHE